MIKLNGLVPVIDANENYKPKPNELLIKITGLRPGEKLIEELFHNTKVLNTKHPRIMKTSDNLKLNNILNKHITQLIKCCDENNLNKISNILSKIDNSFNLAHQKISNQND